MTLTCTCSSREVITDRYVAPEAVVTTAATAMRDLVLKSEELIRWASGLN